MRKLLIPLILIPTLVNAELRNAEFSVWDKVKLKFGFEIEKELSIEMANDHYILKGPPTQKSRVIRDFSRLSSIRPTGNYSIDKPIIIDDIIPSSIKNNKWEMHLQNGPNCHNNTLLSLGLMGRRMHVGVDEFNEYLNQYCEEIDQPEQGAIGVQFSSGNVPMHSYFIVNTDFIYEKRNVGGGQDPQTREFYAPYFRKFSDYRKNNDTFFKCENKDITKTCSAYVIELGNRVDELHEKTGEMIYSLRGSDQKDENKEEAYALEALLFNDSSCIGYQEILNDKIGSIISSYLEMEMTGSIYGRGSYDRLPRI